MDAIEKIVAAVAPKPVNVIVGPSDANALFAAGVKRVSLGADPYLFAMGALSRYAGEVRNGNVAEGANGLPFGDAIGLITGA